MEYPEHNKLRNVKQFHGHISEFLEWCESKGYEICKLDTERQTLTHVPYISIKPREVVAEFFEIDEQKLEAEKRQMIDSLTAKA